MKILRLWEKNPTSFTGLVPLAASRQLSSLIILRKRIWCPMILGILTAAHLMLLGHGKYLVTPQPMAVGHPNLTRCEGIRSFIPFQVSPPSVLLSCSLYPDSDHSPHFAPHPGAGSVKASGWKSLVNSLPSAIFESCMVAHYLSPSTACVLHLTLGIYRFQVPPKRFALQVLS